MSIWDRITTRLFGGAALTSPFADQSHLETVSVLAEIYDLDADVLPITRAQAMTIPAIARIRTAIASTIARMPLRAYDAQGILANQPTICTQPEIGRPAYQTQLWLADQMLFHGRAWAIRHADDGRTQRATRLELIPEQFVTFDPDGLPTGVEGGRRIPPADWIRFDGPHEGILTFGSRTMRAAIAIEAAAGRAADNPIPAIELHQTTTEPMNDEEIDKLVKAWSTARRKRTGGVAYTNAAIETKVHGAAAEHLLVQGRAAIALDLARLCGVPAWVIDSAQSGSSITYANITDRMREFLDWAAGPYMAAIEARMSADDLLPAGQWARFDPSELLRGDLKTQAEAFSAAQAAGILTVEQSAAMYRGRALEETHD